MGAVLVPWANRWLAEICSWFLQNLVPNRHGHARLTRWRALAGGRRAAPRRDSASSRGVPGSDRHPLCTAESPHRVALPRRQDPSRRLTDALGEGTKLLKVLAGGTILCSAS